MNAPTVLVSGSNDITVTCQVEKRWQSFSANVRAATKAILCHSLLKTRLAENLDDDGNPRLRPLPPGLVFPEGRPAMIPFAEASPLGLHDPLALCLHRTRPGAQWVTKDRVSKFSKEAWRSFCTVPEHEVDSEAFDGYLRPHVFVLCGRAGALDPAPKARQAIFSGAIPIMDESPLDSLDGELPAVIEKQWTSEALSAERLLFWCNALAPLFVQSALRRTVIEKLGRDCWWKKIRKVLGDRFDWRPSFAASEELALRCPSPE